MAVISSLRVILLEWGVIFRVIPSKPEPFSPFLDVFLCWVLFGYGEQNGISHSGGSSYCIVCMILGFLHTLCSSFLCLFDLLAYVGFLHKVRPSQRFEL